MDYIKIKFGNDFGMLDSGRKKTIEDIFRSMSPMFSFSERSWKPQMDIYETAKEVIVIAEIAGIDKEKLEVEISRMALKIKGSRNELPRIENATFRLAEIQYGTFERVLYFPVPIDTENVSASYTNGFLQIQLVKLSSDKAYKIAIADG
ncbi:MAG: Hsp20/alpha crystallin family protein [Desulfobacterium sp.]|nr:Hsp20/alpha crystallin family protein [Desulfobacterium sp.]MBU3949809.1 Hsp20/alpha crystallin family protein [Pseudomonadota bacterium]MBU4034856.1 Hsp20/alpha crystallin family protein [Pseudomonadota bacterium]